MTRRQTDTEAVDVAQLDVDELERARGELSLRLEEAGDDDRDAIEAELDDVEAELADRRRHIERAQAAQQGRRQRQIDEREAAHVAQVRAGREELVDLAPKRAAIARKIDKALTGLSAAIDEWRQLTHAQHAAAVRAEIDPHAFTTPVMLAGKISHELATALPHSDFHRWQFDGRDQSFAELDSPFGASPADTDDDNDD